MDATLAAKREAAVYELAQQHCSNHQIAKVLRMSRATVARILKNFARPDCACGRPGTHSGWCSVRTAQSPARQASMARSRGALAHYRRVRSPLFTSGAGGVGADAAVIKAPSKPKPVPVDTDGKATPPVKKGFSMQAMQGAFPLRSSAVEGSVQHHRGHV
jgi:hypothetical protein